MFKTYFVVTALITNNDKILILKKSPDDWNYPNKWSFCSGFIKEFEAAEDTIMREIKEETGLSAEIIKEGGIITVEDNIKKKRWIVSVFLCMSTNTEIKLDHENTEYKWIKKEEVGNFDFVPGVVKDLHAVGFL
jgi:ADP-ribose pyrophosphatase YjhB (NUDIX family)